MKILVVDDEKDVQILFEQRFRKEIRDGVFNFSFCHSGEEAMTYLREHPLEVVMILSDINMPGMSGLELLRQIRQTTPVPPPVVMMITAYGDAEKYNQAMQLGANGFIHKPVDFNALKQQLMSLQ